MTRSKVMRTMIKARIEDREESDTFIVVIFRQDTNFDSQKGDTLSSESKFENKSAINSNVDSSSNNLL